MKLLGIELNGIAVSLGITLVICGAVVYYCQNRIKNIEMANEFLKLPKKLQIHFCRNSSRQSIDEQLQIEMLNEGVKDKFVVKNIVGLFQSQS